jgi:Polyketide cyclase / dehydrase and lipid transport
MLSTIAILIAAAIIVVLLFAATKPDTFKITRATVMTAPPEKIFPYLNDLRKNLEWSPYEKKDPAMQRTFSGAQAGPGAVYEFSGNSQVGAGRIAITESTPSSKVVMTLDMIKPMIASNVVTYALAAKGDATEVTWTMEGKTPYLGKVLHTVMNIDKMVGNDFAKGLANLKAIVEAGP